MIKQLLNSAFERCRDLSVSHRSIMYLLATDKSRYHFAQPRAIIVNYLHDIKIQRRCEVASSQTFCFSCELFFFNSKRGARDRQAAKRVKRFILFFTFPCVGLYHDANKKTNCPKGILFCVDSFAPFI